jgi:hypothetical protein
MEWIQRRRVNTDTSERGNLLIALFPSKSTMRRDDLRQLGPISVHDRQDGCFRSPRHSLIDDIASA